MIVDKVEKIYAYVDETGQDTFGKLFIVAVIVTKKERDELNKLLLEIEKSTGKKKHKWIKTKPEIQILYLEKIFNSREFKNKIYYYIVRNTKAFRDSTIVAIAMAVNKIKDQDKYKTAVFIDGLKDGEVNIVGLNLRRMSIRVEKVRGLRDESNAFIRLADAIVGVVRKYEENTKYLDEIFNQGIKKNTLNKL